MPNVTSWHVNLQEHVRTLIAEEPPLMPVSDTGMAQTITMMYGMNVSTFFVRQKREELGIPTSVERRRIAVETYTIKG